MTVDETATWVVDENLTIVDVPQHIANILFDEWDNSRTLSDKPTIATAENMKMTQFGNASYITIWDMPSIYRAQGIGYLWETATHPISIELRSGIPGVGAEHIRRMEAEVKRIAAVHRKDTFGAVDTATVNGRWWMEHVRTNRMRKDAKLHYKTFMDFDVHEVYASVIT